MSITYKSGTFCCDICGEYNPLGVIDIDEPGNYIDQCFICHVCLSKINMAFLSFNNKQELQNDLLP